MNLIQLFRRRSKQAIHSAARPLACKVCHGTQFFEVEGGRLYYQGLSVVIPRKVREACMRCHQHYTSNTHLYLFGDTPKDITPKRRRRATT